MPPVTAGCPDPAGECFPQRASDAAPPPPEAAVAPELPTAVTAGRQWTTRRLATINTLLTVGMIVVPLLLLAGLGWGGWAVVRRIRLRRRRLAEPVPSSAAAARDMPG